MNARIFVVAGAWLTISLALSSCSSSLPKFTGERDTEPVVRVLLAEKESHVRVGSTAGAILQTVEGVTLLSCGAGDIKVSVREPSLNFEAPDSRTAAANTTARIIPEAGSLLTFKETSYEGILEIRIAADGTLMVINRLGVEAYLEGVLPHEIGDPGPDGYDAVKTQAVAARTYAYNKTVENRDAPFDVRDSILDQVYRGTTGRTDVASSAIHDTRGRVLDDAGRPVKAYYSACCGGHTADIRLMWPDREPADYLAGVFDRRGPGTAAFCSDYRKFRWRYTFTGRELGETLRVTLPRELGIDVEEVGALVDVRVEGRSRSGRVTSILVETTGGAFAIRGDRIRWVLMPDVAGGSILPSTMFRLEQAKDRDRVSFLSIVGGGNGHGVGMCQTGAIAMARKGYTYEMILSHYYPGTRVAKMY